ncbi:MYXO-CTERM domain-containing protein [Brevibacillus sp. IT-7CA2]|uniref:WGxxGxxG family protein n=1 Tax=Brevibacillus sp. IT-7CA2 TaxID=3026436 RepID=UPI0039E08AFD
MKKFNAIILALVLTVTMGLTVYAEAGGTVGAGNTGGTNTPGNTTGNTGVGVTGNGAPANTGINNNTYRTTAVDTDSDWEWIGLLGLAGLFGLRGRNRERNPQK